MRYKYTAAENIKAPAPRAIAERSEEISTTGYIEGAANLPINVLLDDPTRLPQDKAAPTVIYCASGHRGAIGLMAMRMLGWTDVSNLAGGLGAWLAAELPVVK
jgi:rhodanese-related sulfurtransferase